jgi:hypothetical protein
MRAALRVTIVLSVAAATPLLAQSSDCSPYGGTTRRVCDAAVDGTRAFHPVAGLLVSGGNPVLGTAGTLGGLGHFSVTVRGNAARVVLPETGYDGSTTTVPASDELFAPVPLVEAAAGIYGGMPSGLLAIDLLLSAQLLPTDQIDNLAVAQGARRLGDVALGLGYGARVGILSELGPVPAVSVSLMRRDIPELAYGDIEEGDQYRYAVDLHATNLRLIASKHLATLEVAAGLGWDKYTGDAVIQFRDPATSTVEPAIALELDQSRALLFLDAGLDLRAVRLAGELGYQTGKDQELSTDFEDFDTTSGKIFGSLGARVAF